MQEKLEKMILYFLRGKKAQNTGNPSMQDNSGLPLEKSVTYCQLQFDAFFVCAVENNFSSIIHSKNLKRSSKYGFKTKVWIL